MSESQWERIGDFLPGRKEHVGRPAAGNRAFVNSVPWVPRPVARFQDLLALACSSLLLQLYGYTASTTVVDRFFRREPGASAPGKSTNCRGLQVRALVHSPRKKEVQLWY